MLLRGLQHQERAIGKHVVVGPGVSSIGGRILTGEELLDLARCNALLADLNCLGALPSVYRMSIERLGELRSLRGLASLTSVVSEVEILDNPVLPSCEVEWLTARLAADPPRRINASGNDGDGICP